MIQVTFVLSLIATYLTAVAGANGRGSRKLWIACIFLGLLIALGAVSIGKAQFGIDIDKAIFAGDGAITNIEVFIVRVAFGFSFGSFLAVLLFRKKPAVESLGLK